MEQDTKGKQNRSRTLAKEIAAKESPEDTDTDDSESRATLPTNDRNSCHNSIERTWISFCVIKSIESIEFQAKW